MKNEKDRKVVVVANDAGGAEAIAPYILAHRHRYGFVVYSAGPAQHIFKRERIPYSSIADDLVRIAGIMKRHRDARFAIVGTGWMTQIELRALRALKDNGVRTIAFLESWEHYRERFGFPKKGWKSNIPDEIWVGDDAAKRMAQRLFPRIPVTKKKENYFSEMKRRYSDARKGKKKEEILFLSVCVPGATAALEALLRAMSEKRSGQRVAIRFHPADSRDRYDDLIGRYRGSIAIRKSTEKDIVCDLAKAKMVVGTETVAMALSAHLRIPTVSLGKVGKRRFLPFPEIVLISDPRSIRRLI